MNYPENLQFKYCTRIYSPIDDTCSCIKFKRLSYCVHSEALKSGIRNKEIQEGDIIIERKPNVKQKNIKGTAMKKI